MLKLGNVGKAVIIGGTSLFITAAAGIGFYLNAPSNMFSVDVNPSIELHTNRLGYVVSIDPVNEDAKVLMAGYQLKDKDLETVIGDIVDRMIMNGYLVSEDTNQILLTADIDASEDFVDKLNSVFTDYLQEKQLDVTVLDQVVDMDANLDAAHANEISVGKMAMIEKLSAENGNLSAEDLADETIKQLMQLAVDQGISVEDLITNYNDVVSKQGAFTDIISPTAFPVATDTESTVEDTDTSEDSKDIENEDMDFDDAEDAEIEDSDENSSEDTLKEADDSDDDNDKVVQKKKKTETKYKKEDASKEDGDYDTDSDDEDSSYEDSQEEDSDENDGDRYEDIEDSDDGDEDAYEKEEDSNESYKEDSNYQDSNDEDNDSNDDEDSQYENEDGDKNYSYSDSNGDNEDDNNQGDNRDGQGDEDED